MNGIMLVVMLAIITEALVEYAKSIGHALFSKDVKKAITQLGAIVVSVLLCFTANADLFRVVGITFSWSWLGCMLTGILGSRGANYVSDLLSKLQNTKNT